MKKVFFVFALLITACITSCGVTGKTTKVVKPRYHMTSPKNKYRIDIPIGTRHLRLFARRRTKVVRMN